MENDVQSKEMQKQKQKASLVIKKLFDLLEIKKVVSVDDDNSNLPDFINFRDVCFKLPLERRKEFSELADIHFDVFDVGSEELERCWNKLSESEQNSLYQRIYQVYSKNLQQDSQDIGRGDMGILEELLKDFQFSNLSLEQWRKSKERILHESRNKKTLLLFDQNFSKEGASTTAGIEHIRDLFTSRCKQDKIVCALLSHTFQPGEEHYTWEALAGKYDVRLDEFIPISKTRLHEEPMRFVRMLKLAALNHDCAELKDEVSKVLRSAQDDAIERIGQINIYDFEHMVFQSSVDEGIWEPETLFRLFSLFQRSKAREEARSNPNVREIATRIRKVSDISIEYKDAPKHNSWKIRREEVYDSANLINKLYMPIDLGDVFELTVGQETKQYLLVSQPCDLMVRPNGKRNTAVIEGTVAEIVDGTNENGQPIHPEAHYELPYFLEDGKSRFVSFRKRHTVKLSILDLCVYREDGQATFSLCDTCPAMVIPAWQNHHKKVIVNYVEEIIRSYQETQNYMQCLPEQERDKLLRFVECKMLYLPVITTGGREEKYLFDGHVDIVSSSVNYSLRRVERLSQPYSSAMLTKFAAYIARTAFDHDFGRETKDAG